MARAIENWAFRAVTLCVSGGIAARAFWPKSGDTATTPIDQSGRDLSTVTLIKDLPDS